MKRVCSVLLLALVLIPTTCAQVTVAQDDDDVPTIGYLSGNAFEELDIPNEPDGSVRILATGGSLIDGSWATVIYNGLEDLAIVGATVTPDESTGLEPSDLLVPGVIPSGEIGFIVSDLEVTSDDASTLSDNRLRVDLTVETAAMNDVDDDFDDGDYGDYQPVPVDVSGAVAIPDADDGPVILATLTNLSNDRVTPPIATAVCLNDDFEVTGVFQEDLGDFYSFLPPSELGGSTLATIAFDVDAGCGLILVAATSDYETVDE